MKGAILALSIILCLASSPRAQKQTISQAEYFIGADPGEGNGTALNIQSGNAQDSLAQLLIASHPIGYGGVVFVRVKSSGFINTSGTMVPGAWSFPTAVVFPTTAVLLAAQAEIRRPSLGYPLLENIFPLSGSFDSVAQWVAAKIAQDSLEVGDSLYVRLQGKDQLWGYWQLVTVLNASNFAGVSEGPSIANDNLTIFPNPVTSSFTVSFTNPSTSPIHYEIDDVLGRILASGETADAQLSLSASDLPAGVLLLRASSNGFVQTRPFVVVK